MRTFFAIVIVLCFGMVGIELWKGRLELRDIIGEIRSLCLHMMNCVRFERRTPEEIICSFCRQKELIINICVEQIRQGEEFLPAWSHMLSCPEVHKLSKEEISLLTELGEQFGKTDVEGELARLDAIYQQLVVLHVRRCEDCCQQGKTYITTGFLVGALTALIIF